MSIRSVLVVTSLTSHAKEYFTGYVQNRAAGSLPAFNMLDFWHAVEFMADLALNTGKMTLGLQCHLSPTRAKSVKYLYLSACLVFPAVGTTLPSC